MPFFPQHALFPEASLYQIFTSLDPESHAQSQAKQASQACQPRRRAQPTPSFTPAFDVAETDAAYELYGELPGLEQKDVEIEFTDAQTIIIKGKTQRSVSQIAQPAQAQGTKEVKEKDIETESVKSHTATVEDEYDEADTPLPTPSTTPSTTVAAEKTLAPAVEKPAEKQAPKPKFWVAERKVGEFARSFSFAQRIEHESVQAGLKNGILRVVVPKSQKTGKVVVDVF